MHIRDRKALKQFANARLSEATYDPRLLMLIHTGVSLSVTLLISVLSFILEQQIGSTGGLSGIGLRSVLTTAQSALQLASMVMLPFWEIGMVYAAMRLARRQSAFPGDLTAGFRRFGPVLRLMLLRAAVSFGIISACANVAATVFMITPLSAPTVAVLQPLWDAAASSGLAGIELSEATLAALIPTLLPVIPIFLGLLLIALVPILYRLRLADYVIMEEEKTGALFALIISWRLTRHQVISLFRLDLSFWWFYALQAAAVLLAYCNDLLLLLGVTLPISAAAADFLFYGIYALAMLALFWRFGSYYHTTFATAYNALRQEAPEQFFQKRTQY